MDISMDSFAADEDAMTISPGIKKVLQSLRELPVVARLSRPKCASVTGYRRHFSRLPVEQVLQGYRTFF
jgi:hypothetical protein